MMSTIADAAVSYHAMGWKPVPVHRKTKRAIGKGWQNQPYSPAAFNGNAVNVAVQLGAVSGGLVDVDLDCQAAIGFAPEFLPATDAIFGRRSKPCSHQLYFSDLHETEGKANLPFQQYINGRLGPMIVELRIGGGSKGATTVLPPSMHAIGERVEWVNDGQPARVDGEHLKCAVLQLAVACLLKAQYPGTGSRHDAALVIGGVLARAGWQANEIHHLVKVVAQAVGDEEAHERAESAAAAVTIKAKGNELPGWPRLAEVWGEDVAKTLGKWLPTAAPDQHARNGAGAGLEDAVGLAFAEQHATHFRYVAKFGRWLQWTGMRWQFDETLVAFDEARTLCRQAGDARAKTVAGVTVLARSDRRLAATVEQWDADSWLLNTPAGVMDLKSGEMRLHKPEDYMTKITAVAPEGACPMWLAFLKRITGDDGALQQFLQRLCGYALTGSNREHALFFLHGTGANGKSVFVNTVSGLLADYHRIAPIETFTASSGDRHPTDIAMLRGARLVTAVETEEGRRWAEAKIKSLTGGDRISARFMRQDFFEYTPQFKLLIAGNHKPSLRTVDEAIRRRFNLIPFTVTIPLEERDDQLTERLKAEWPGILAWMIDGCGDWQERGLAPPQCVTGATDAYLAAQDAIGAWIEEKCRCHPDLWGGRSALWESWVKWATANGEFVGTRSRLIDALEDRGFEPTRIHGGQRGFRGLEPIADLYGDTCDR
jgi:putative DNA primase/helicase